MKLKFTYLLLIALAFPSISISQSETEAYLISQITFSGNNRTESDYLELFLKSKVGSVIDQSKIDYDIQRLKNIVSIQQVDCVLDTIKNQNIHLTFEVSEVRTLLPVINFGGIKDNFWYQIGFTDINWGGRGKQLLIYYQNVDGRNGGEVFLRNQFIKGSQWGYSANLQKYASSEPLYFQEGPVQYEYDLLNIGASAIRNFGLNKSTEFGLTAFRERYRQSAIQVLENPPGPQDQIENKILAKFKYQQDHLDYHNFYLNRHHLWAQFQTVYNLSDGLLFHTFSTTFKRFWRIGQTGNIASRFRFGISTNRDTPFAPFVVDSFTNLRGIGNRIDRGTAQLILNIEYRQTVFDRYDWASQIVGFTDIGTWRNPGGELKQLVDPDQFRQFVGGGVRVIYKKIYGAILRVDFGVDIFNTQERGLIIGFGQYF